MVYICIIFNAAVRRVGGWHQYKKGCLLHNIQCSWLPEGSSRWTIVTEMCAVSHQAISVTRSRSVSCSRDSYGIVARGLGFSVSF